MSNQMDFGTLGWMVSGLAAVALICLWIWRKRWAKRADGPTCGRCGYDVRGLPSSICPECGSDLKTVGIVEPGMAGRMTVGLRVLYWTLLVAIISPGVVWLGMRYGPAYRHDEAAYEMVPKSGAVSKVFISYWGKGVGTTAPVEVVKCMFDPPNKITVILEVYKGGKTCSYQDQNWQRVPKPFDESAVLAAMRTGAVDTSPEQVKTEAAELCRILRGIADGSRRTVSPANFTWWPQAGVGFRRVETPAWMRYTYLALCAAVWRTGWWWMVRQERQKRERELASQRASSVPRKA